MLTGGTWSDLSGPDYDSVVGSVVPEPVGLEPDDREGVREHWRGVLWRIHLECATAPAEDYPDLLVRWVCALSEARGALYDRTLAASKQPKVDVPLPPELVGVEVPEDYRDMAADLLHPKTGQQRAEARRRRRAAA